MHPDGVLFLKVGTPLGCILNLFVSSHIFPLLSNVLALWKTRATTFQSSGGTPPSCKMHPDGVLTFAKKYLKLLSTASKVNLNK